MGAAGPSPKTPRKDAETARERLARTEEVRSTKDIEDLMDISDDEGRRIKRSPQRPKATPKPKPQLTPALRSTATPTPKSKAKPSPSLDAAVDPEILRVYGNRPIEELQALVKEQEAKFAQKAAQKKPPAEPMETIVVDTDSEGTKTPGPANDPISLGEFGEVRPETIEPNASISGVSEQAVLETVAGEISDDAVGSPADEQEVEPSTAENGEQPPAMPEDEEPLSNLKRKVCFNPIF